MFPDHPTSPYDLLPPLPRCDGPKLEPFDFQGPQNIEFLAYLGAGLHSHVVKVKIKNKEYALKLVSESWQLRKSLKVSPSTEPPTPVSQTPEGSSVI